MRPSRLEDQFATFDAMVAESRDPRGPSALHFAKPDPFSVWS
jgi:hypothetical protein